VSASRRQLLQVAAGGLAGTFLRSPAGAAPEPFRAIPKAMWVWKTPLDELDTLRAFAGRWGVRRVLLALNPASIDRLWHGDTAPLTRLHADGIAVSALAGDPAWAEHRGLPRTIERLVELANRSGALIGLDLDIEPHTLKAWHAGDDVRARLLQGLLAQIEAIRAHAGRLPVGAALNPVYARLTLPDGGNGLEALARRLDAVQLMAYRPAAQATVAWAAPAVAALERAGTPWWSGVLVHAGDEKGTSYFGQPAAQFMTDMVNLHRSYADPMRYRAYQGLVFEDYAGLRDMLRGQEVSEIRPVP
jgi:hypothetical protein